MGEAMMAQLVRVTTQLQQVVDLTEPTAFPQSMPERLALCKETVRPLLVDSVDMIQHFMKESRALVMRCLNVSEEECLQGIAEVWAAEVLRLGDAGRSVEELESLRKGMERVGAASDG
jgi:hypothetical protein